LSLYLIIENLNLTDPGPQHSRGVVHALPWWLHTWSPPGHGQVPRKSGPGFIW